MENIESKFSANKIELISFSPFKYLNIQEINFLYNEAILTKYVRGEVVFKEGSRLSGFYFITRGTLKLFKKTNNEKVQVLDFVGAGSLIGYHSVVNNETSSLTAVALETSKVYCILSTAFLDLMQNNLKFSEWVLRIACRDLQNANILLTNLTLKKLKENLADTLLRIKSRFDFDETNVLKIPLSRNDIANYVGGARGSVIRLLWELKKDEIVEASGLKIRILNLEKLHKIANR